MLLILKNFKGGTGVQCTELLWNKAIAKIHKSLRPMWNWHLRSEDIEAVKEYMRNENTCIAVAPRWFSASFLFLEKQATRSRIYQEPLKNNQITWLYSLASSSISYVSSPCSLYLNYQEAEKCGNFRIAFHTDLC